MLFGLVNPRWSFVVTMVDGLQAHRYRRASGLLLHPTSLPGPHGIGDLGTEAYRFIDFLAESGQGL